MMLLYRRAFQNFVSINRLRWHHLLYISQSNRTTIACSINTTANSCQQIVRTKTGVIAHQKDHQIQHFDTDQIIDDNQQIPKSNLFKTNCKPLPFEAIPCADQSNTILNHFTGIIAFLNQWKQLLTAKWDNQFHDEIHKCHQQFGPIFRKSLGSSKNVIFIQSPDLLRDVFVYEGKYPKHPLPEAWTFYNQLHNCQRGLFFMDDVEWLETRKQLAPLMLRNDQRFSTAIENATDDLIESWKQIAIEHQHNRHSYSCNGFTELPQALTSLYGWSIRVLVGIMFGNAAHVMCNELRETIDHFAQIVQNVFEDTVPFSSISPHLAHKFRLPIWLKFETSVTQTLNIANEIIEFGLKHCDHCNDNDGLLIELKRLGMSNEMIKRIFVDLIIAAGDTTAFSTQWAMYLLSLNEQIQDKIRHELFEMDKLDTPLIRGTVRETLRLFPVATFIGRILGKDAILNNYHIDKNSLVLISMYSAGRDETSFPHANEFQPNRWNRDPHTGTLKFVNRAQSSIPYALGARNCIGQRIANAQMHIILSKLLRTFKVQLLNANEIDIVMRLIIMPSKPMRFAVKPID
ncbi:cytochrome P450 315a1, mitochondrial [Contarinia nasturtii]|uniref:cytochrome P450 315a1, mitochondrial n=1 Tax=Contarinia nasturtii TaxID=265458 RepID=UPI0012D49FDC|nr:cytochrome P450 315a1, mitochondrial [Contarinia nasturtii]XP_031629834.1 cytochrome P450 315a1, mitochondrial [Contarinia nasturtii]XP_031629835.1 cytochrome P450 315a1, mitochondrial [Contarinia nasturtii]XP_031629836.1 cytochrome P450 315a1, mitochondrial [Contarinia nasturtii]